MVSNSLMVKYASQGITWQENLAYSRVSSIPYDIYLIASFVRFDMNKYKWVALASGILVMLSRPITYSIIRKINISIYNQVYVITNGLIVLCAYIILGERFNNIQLAGIILSVIAFTLLMWGTQ